MNETTNPNPQRRKRGILTGTLVGLVLAGGGLSIAAAAQGAPSTTRPAGQEQDAGEGRDATYTSSVTAAQAPETKEGNQADKKAADKAEADAWTKLATVTPQQATDAATAAVPGTAATPQLTNENGSVVYDVMVTSADGKTTTDVVIDAGNAKVLAQEVDNEHEGNERNEGNEGNDAQEKGDKSEAPTPDGSAPATTPGAAPGN